MSFQIYYRHLHIYRNNRGIPLQRRRKGKYNKTVSSSDFYSEEDIDDETPGGGSAMVMIDYNSNKFPKQFSTVKSEKAFNFESSGDTNGR